ncbi:MAG: DUF1326 domain-containing protein [Acidobacteria bacterium]|nr:DUF1326 domain-containing protein [Acidobacteriota bacterium]MBI3281469.1 DUF1326 domain-containing protein [Acidobacteriota bacterium]
MKEFAVCVSLAACTAWAGSLPTTSLRGQYIEARTADVYTGPCFANSEVDLVGNLAVFGWKINQGTFEGVQLDGLAVVAAIRASSTLGNVHASAYPVKSIVIVDERATPEQRLALKAFARRMGGDLLQDIVGVHTAPIQFQVDGSVHGAKAKLSAGTLAAIQTRAINEGDHLCSNEENWYRPLTKVSHAMPAFALAHSFSGQELGTRWNSPEKRSAYVGEFELNN